MSFSVIDRTDRTAINPDEFVRRFHRAARGVGENVTAAVEKRARWEAARRIRGGGQVKVDPGREPYTNTWERETVVFGASMICIVRNTSRHAPYVERGRGPGKMPPDAAIRGWLTAHGDLAGLKKSAANSRVFLTRRAIGRKGTKGKNIVRDVQQRPFGAAAVNRVIGDELRRALAN